MSYRNFCHTTGGRDVGGYSTDVLKYDPEADEWSSVGQLAIGQYYHAMSKVPLSTSDYCPRPPEQGILFRIES